jgi:hypothetical protein
MSEKSELDSRNSKHRAVSFRFVKIQPISKSIVFCCALLAATGIAFGAGEYQPTRDDKTKIWNWTPKSGETASWSGGRDKDGYASGFGDLTLYDASGKASGVYYGNMVHGKFEGPVNVHSGNRTLHAYFASGDRMTGWARGRAPSNMPVPEEAQKLRAETAKHKPEEAKVATKKQEPAESEPTPVIKKAKPATAKIAKTETTPPPVETPRGSETYHKQTAENVPAPTEEKKAPLSGEEELKRTEPARSTSSPRAFAEPTPLPKIAVDRQLKEPVSSPTPARSESPREVKESSAPVIEETPPVLHESASQPTPEIAQQESAVRETPTAVGEAKSQSSSTPSDVSVNALVGPPSSLHIESPGQSSPAAKQSEAPVNRSGALTEADAVRLADEEAKSHGCPLEKYDRPKVDHSVVKGKWTLFYSLKPEAGSELPPAFSATVEDKTHLAQIHK